jgi:hypothetical protein
MDRRMRTPVIDSAFVGWGQRIRYGLTMEVSAMANSAKRLLESDLINRFGSDPEDVDGRLRQDLGGISYRASTGESSWAAGSAAVRWEQRTGFIAANYTWSHAIDRQSDPLRGDFFDLSPVLSGANADTDRSFAAFARQFDAQADRGNADFDQRHRVAAYGVVQLPGIRHRILQHPLSGWSVSGMLLWRSGPVFSVYGSNPGTEEGSGSLINNRADLLLPGSVWLPGRKALNPAAFRSTSDPDFLTDRLGILGRNALRGPTHLNHDLSLQKRVNILPERITLTIRAEAYNILNRANATIRGDTVDTTNFGQMQYGAAPEASVLSTVAPFRAQSRQVQFLLRMEF